MLFIKEKLFSANKYLDLLADFHRNLPNPPHYNYFYKILNHKNPPPCYKMIPYCLLHFTGVISGETWK